MRLMLDLMVLAFWSDTTRIATFMFGNEPSQRVFSFMGVRGEHHYISHHGNGKKLEDYQRINTWYVCQYAYMLERMRKIKEGDRTLLDNSMVLFASALRDGNKHEWENLPVVLAGRAGGAIRPGRHLVYPKKTPLCNLYRSMLRYVGAPVPSFADSTGELRDLEA